MAIQDIPEFVEVGPGDLIRAEDWNGMQQQMRESLRTHHHSRPIGTAPNDAGMSDDAEQISTTGIADGAITASKLAPGSVSASSIAPGAITETLIADLAVTAGKIGNAAVTSAKISLATLGTGSLTLNGGNISSDLLVQQNAKAGTIFLQNVSLATGSAVGCEVVAQIVYKWTGVGFNVFLRVTNTGTAQAAIIWKVLTFAS